MQQIHSEVAEAFYSTPRGGVETGGVLYGVRESSRVAILAARPLRCEHASGPSFNLSAGDLVRFAELLRAPALDRGLAGMVVVGWYHSHTRSEISLTDSDLEFHQRYFPEPWQFALVLRPAPMRPTRVCFYFQEAGGGVRASELYREIAPRAARPVLAPPAARVPEAVPVPVPAPAPVREPPRRAWRMWPLAAVLAVLLTLAGTSYVTRDYWMPRVAGPGPGLRLQVTDRAGQLEVRWDSTLPFVRQAERGTLEFQDGTTRRFTALDPQFLRVGSVNYARQSDTVTVRMAVVKPDGSRLEGMVSFLGQAPPSLPAAPTAEVQPPPDDTAAQAERARLEAERKKQQDLETEKERERKRLAQRREEEAKRLAAQQQKAQPAPVQPPPAQTASAQAPPPVQTPPPKPPVPQLIVAASKPAVETPAVTPPPPAPAADKPVSQPKPETLPAKPAAPPPAPLSGQWAFTRAQPSGSPFPPESVTLSLTDDGKWLRGTFVGRYRTPRNSGVRSDMSFSFGGPVRSGSMKFPWTAGDGSKGEIELIRLPNSSDSIEVVWYPADRKYVFDDILARPKR
ncbi:MAG: hypothetical protein HY822_00500 [Acidobacteria bacterium]|nr:hypothetical protein [Acidobacteriota bacterium]